MARKRVAFDTSAIVVLAYRRAQRQHPAEYRAMLAVMDRLRGPRAKYMGLLPAPAFGEFLASMRLDRQERTIADLEQDYQILPMTKLAATRTARLGPLQGLVTWQSLKWDAAILGTASVSTIDFFCTLDEYQAEKSKRLMPHISSGPPSVLLTTFP